MLHGVCARNDYEWPDSDFHAIKKARIEILKTMSHTSPAMYEKARVVNPDIQFVVRLYDPSIGVGHHPTPHDFVNSRRSEIKALSNFTDLFIILNEPNHPARYEGWGSSENDARDFRDWYRDVLRLLKQEYPDLKFGFPGLAVPHNDILWLDICRPVINDSDFLGTHLYWQNWLPEHHNHLSTDWGMRVLQYVNMFSNKEIHVLEGGNSNLQSGHPLNEDQMAEELMIWYEALTKFNTVKSASPFILSSQDPYWDQCGFTWIAQDGRFKEIIYRMEERV